MNRLKNVQGSQITVPTLEVNVDTVYIRTDVQRIETERFTGWQYDEIQYTLREFHELIGSQTALQDEYLVEVDFRLTLIEMGL